MTMVKRIQFKKRIFENHKIEKKNSKIKTLDPLPKQVTETPIPKTRTCTVHSESLR
jgi:hypothetical protein